MAELGELQTRFGFDAVAFEPHVYWRITHDWMELTVRFLTRAHGTRDVKDQMSRYIHQHFAARGIAIATTRYELIDGGAQGVGGPAASGLGNTAAEQLPATASWRATA